MPKLGLWDFGRLWDVLQAPRVTGSNLAESDGRGTSGVVDERARSVAGYRPPARRQVGRRMRMGWLRIAREALFPRRVYF